MDGDGHIWNSPTLFGVVPFPTSYGSSTYGLQIWPVHSQGPSEQKPIKLFGEKGSWAYPGTAQIY